MEEIKHVRVDEISGRSDKYTKGKNIDGDVYNVKVIKNKKMRISKIEQCIHFWIGRKNYEYDIHFKTRDNDRKKRGRR